MRQSKFFAVIVTFFLVSILINSFIQRTKDEAKLSTRNIQCNCSRNENVACISTTKILQNHSQTNNSDPDTNVNSKSCTNNAPLWGTFNTSLFVTTVFTGRLGNELFNYAFLLGVAIAQNRKPVIHKAVHIQETFKISYVNTNISFNGWPVINEISHHKFDAKFFNLHEVNLTLNGQFHSWRYFHHANYEIRREFTFHDHLQKEADELIAQYRGRLKNNILVAIHSRRGDHLDSNQVNYGFNNPKATYYLKAIAHMSSLLAKQNVTFVMASDDLEWCRRNLNDSGIIFLPPMSRELHMSILASCDHMIIGTGTYGWWTAWLVNGITIYYKDFIRQGSQFAAHFDASDYYLPGWIGLGD